MQKITFLKTFIAVRWFHRFKSIQQLQRYQKRRLQKQWNYFKRHSPYFAKCTSWKDVSTMNKDIMMEHFDQLNTVQASKEELVRQAVKNEQTRQFDQNVNGISVGLSSGTSGHRGLFITTKKEQAIWAATILAKLLPKNCVFGHRVAFFLRANNQLYETVRSPWMQFEYFDTFQAIENHIERLNQYQPSILIAPASMLVRLAKAIAKDQLRIQPKMVVSVAEVLETSDRSYLLKWFPVEIIHQVYQATEGFLACTCQYGQLHINEDVVYIEKQQLDEQRFYPIITDLYRTSQPIVRYVLNDILVLATERCPCGSVFTHLAKIEGRSDDVFVFKNRQNERIEVFPDFIRRCLLFVPDIIDYQVTQVAFDQIEVSIDQLSSEQKKQIKMEFKKLADQLGFLMPTITFESYVWDPTVKLKRICKKFKETEVEM